MYCKVCGAEIVENALYCQHCGTRTAPVDSDISSSGDGRVKAGAHSGYTSQPDAATQAAARAAQAIRAMSNTPNSAEPRTASTPEASPGYTTHNPESNSATDTHANKFDMNSFEFDAAQAGDSAAAAASLAQPSPDFASFHAPDNPASYSAHAGIQPEDQRGPDSFYQSAPAAEHPPAHYKKQAEDALPSPEYKSPYAAADPIVLTLEPYKEDLVEYERRQAELRAAEERRKEQEARDAATLKIAEQAAQRAAELAAQKVAAQAAAQRAADSAQEATAQAASARRSSKTTEFSATPDYKSWHDTSGTGNDTGNTYTSRLSGATHQVSENYSAQQTRSSSTINVDSNTASNGSAASGKVVVNVNTGDGSGNYRTYRSGYEDGYHSARRENHHNVLYKSRWLAMLLCMFGGVLGLHRFYTGKIFSGLIYLFTGGFFGVGWIIDLVLIVIGGFRDSDGHFLQ